MVILLSVNLETCWYKWKDNAHKKLLLHSANNFSWENAIGNMEICSFWSSVILERPISRITDLTGKSFCFRAASIWTFYCIKLHVYKLQLLLLLFKDMLSKMIKEHLESCLVISMILKWQNILSYLELKR